MPVKIDIIILSLGKTEALRETTKHAVQSLFSSEDPEKIVFNAIVVESHPVLRPYQYPGTELMKLPMSFFDTKTTGNIMERISDEKRIESFLTGTTFNIVFSSFNFIVFAFVIAWYNFLIFGGFAPKDIL